LSALPPVLLVVPLLVVALLHDGVVGGVGQHIGRKVPAVERRIAGVRRRGVDDGRC
jgi:hypothetical protein